MQMLFQADLGKQTPDEVRRLFWSSVVDVDVLHRATIGAGQVKPSPQPFPGFRSKNLSDAPTRAAAGRSAFMAMPSRLSRCSHSFCSRHSAIAARSGRTIVAARFPVSYGTASRPPPPLAPPSPPRTIPHPATPASPPRPLRPPGPGTRAAARHQKHRVGIRRAVQHGAGDEQAPGRGMAGGAGFAIIALDDGGGRADLGALGKHRADVPRSMTVLRANPMRRAVSCQFTPDRRNVRSSLSRASVPVELCRHGGSLEGPPPAPCRGWTRVVRPKMSRRTCTRSSSDISTMAR